MKTGKLSKWLFVLPFALLATRASAQVACAGAACPSAGGGAAGTEYTEGATDATITGPAFMWEDVGDVLRAISAAKPLPVAIISGAGSGGTASQDNAAYAPGTTNFTPIGGEVDDTATTAATENSAAAARMTVQRALHVNLRDNTGAELAVGGGTQYDEDTVSTAADKLNMCGVVRKDTAAALAGTDGDRTQLEVDASGRLWTNGSSVTQPVSGTVTANAGTGTFTVGDGAGALNTIVDSGTITANAGTGTFTVGDGAGALNVIVDSSALSAGASTLAEQQTQTTSLAAHTTALQIIDNLPVAQGSTTAGQSGSLLMGAVTTSAPTYTTAQTSPVSLSTTGNVRVEIAAVTAAGQVDDAAFTVATSEVTPIGGCVTSDSADSGDAACIKITTDRKQVIVGGDAAGSPTAGQVITVQGIASATPVIVGDGTGALNVIVDSSALPSGAATAADQATQTASLSVLDDWDETDRAKVNLIAGQAGITAGAGAVAANTPRMTHASDDPMVTLLTTLTTVATGLKYNSVGTTEDEHAVKASAGTLWSITTTNTNAAARYIRCANAVAGSTTPGTTTPVIDLAIPGATTGAGFTTSFPKGFAFSTALTCWLVVAAADTDVAEVAANEIKVLYTFN